MARVKHKLNKFLTLILLDCCLVSIQASSLPWPSGWKVWPFDDDDSNRPDSGRPEVCVAPFTDSMLVHGPKQSTSKSSSSGINSPDQSSNGIDQIRFFEDQELGSILRFPDTAGFKLEPSQVDSIRPRFDIMTPKGQAMKQEFRYLARNEEQLNGIRLCNKTRPYPFNFTALNEAKFRMDRPTVIIIPGYLSLELEPWIEKASYHWLDLADVNLIRVSWTSSNQGSYENAIANGRFVARQTLILLYYLSQLDQASISQEGQQISTKGLFDEKFLSRMHLIGHSCGAHIAGFIGEELGGKVGRISGLDPAGPHFDQFKNTIFRLDPSDAKLVDVYHSNLGKLDRKTLACSYILDKFHEKISKDWMCPASNVGVDANPELPGSWLGIDQTLGHVDFYLNDGHKQPGCRDRTHICDHGRAHDLVVDLLASQLVFRSPEAEDRNQSGSMSALDRPLAFKSDTHRNFQVGTSLAKAGCPWIMSSLGNRISASLEQPERQFDLDQCTVPLDFLTEPEVYKRELEERFKVKMDAKGENKYYFATTSEYQSDSSDEKIMALVSDHFLVRLKLSDGKFKWQDNCKLEMTLEFEGARKVNQKRLILNQDQLGSNRAPIGVPFNHPRGMDLRNGDIKQLMENPDRDSIWWAALNSHLSRPIGSPISLIFPSKISLSSSGSKGYKIDNQANRTAQEENDEDNDDTGNDKNNNNKNNDNNDDQASSWWRSGPVCELELSYVSIEPIWSRTRSFYGIYSRKRKDESNNNNKDEQQQVKPAPMELLQKSRNFDATLGGKLEFKLDSKRAVELELQSILLDG